MFGHNKGLGFFPQGMGGMGMSGDPMMGMPPRQLNLVPSEGFSGNGMATIGTDNTFSVIAHLPPAHTFSPYSPAIYAAYLVDAKGKNGFYAGTLRPAGNGMYQANFRSPVPLVHYDKVVISLESPQSIMQSPQGPIVMKVKEGFIPGLEPVKKAGSNMWGKVRGFIGSRMGGKEQGTQNQPAATAPSQTSGQIPVQPQVQYPQQSQYSQYPQYTQNQQYSQNPQYAHNPQYAAQQRAYPQQGYSPRMYQPVQPAQQAQSQFLRPRANWPNVPQSGYQQGPVMQAPPSPAPVQPFEVQPAAPVAEQMKSQVVEDSKIQATEQIPAEELQN